MNRAIRGAVVAFSLAACTASAHADEQTIRRVFTKKLTTSQVLSVVKTRYAGLYEVTVKGERGFAVFYTDAQGDIMLIGNMIETRTDRNLTEERLSQVAAIDWNQLPFQWAVTTRRGDGRRQIAIFSDPNCPYCRKFERELAAVDNITVHLFIWPVVKPESVRQTKADWCSKDRVKAWNELLFRQVEPTAAPDCENPIDELIALGKRLGGTGTPTWFLRDGRRYTGAIPMNDVVPLLDATAERK